MKRRSIIIIIALIIFSFKQIRAEADISLSNKITAALSEIKNSKDYNIVKKHLADENDEFKIASVYMLISLDSKSASSDLKKIYKKSSYEVKRNIIYALGEIKLKENIDFLAEQLNTSERKEINNEAIVALIKTNDANTIRPLINYMDQFPKNEYISKYMPRLGFKVIKPLFLNLPDGDENIADVSKYVINEVINEQTVDSLMEILKLSISEIDPVKRLAKELIDERREVILEPAVQLYKTADGRLIEELSRLLSGFSDGSAVINSLNKIWKELPDDDRKIGIINIISNYKTDVYNEFLIEKVTNSSEKVRNHILSKMDQKDFFANRMIKILIDTNDENVRNTCKDILINLGGGDFRDLLSLLTTGKYSSYAEEILIKIKNKKVDMDILLVLAREEKLSDYFNEKIRNIIIERVPLSIETLIETLKYKALVNESEDLLIKIGKQTIPYLINVLINDENDLQISAATEIFIRMGKMTAPFLMEGLKVDDLWSKMNIANVLVKFKKNEVISALIEILETDDIGLQYRAIYGLRDLGDAAVPGLIKNLNTSKENTFIGIVRSLGEIKNKTALAPLKEKMASVQSEKSRAEIEKALKKIGE